MSLRNLLSVDISETKRIVGDRLQILFHDDIFIDLVFELAIDALNVRITCEFADEVIEQMVYDKVNKFLISEEVQKRETTKLIVSCINDILTDIGSRLYTGVADNFTHIQYEKIDNYNNLVVRMFFDEDF